MPQFYGPTPPAAVSAILNSPPLAPTPGAPYCREWAVEYRVAYRVLPDGVGPDDYESGDLEPREDVVDLPAPSGGYGPAISEIRAALRDMLDGAEPIAIRILD